MEEGNETVERGIARGIAHTGLFLTHSIVIPVSKYCKHNASGRAFVRIGGK
jgi:hypothetical protein